MTIANEKMEMKKEDFKYQKKTFYTGRPKKKPCTTLLI